MIEKPVRFHGIDLLCALHYVCQSALKTEETLGPVRIRTLRTQQRAKINANRTS